MAGTAGLGASQMRLEDASLALLDQVACQRFPLLMHQSSLLSSSSFEAESRGGEHKSEPGAGWLTTLLERGAEHAPVTEEQAIIECPDLPAAPDTANHCVRKTLPRFFVRSLCSPGAEPRR